MYEPCPECDADVRYGHHHEPECALYGVDADSLAERRRDQDRQAHYERAGARGC